jgi:hypothetical protein
VLKHKLVKYQRAIGTRLNKCSGYDRAPPLPAALVAVYSLTHLLPLRSAQYSSATLDFERQTNSATARSPAGAARARGADLKARYLCTEGAKVPTIKGRLQSPRDINSRPAPKKGPLPLQVIGSTPCLRYYASENAYKFKTTFRQSALLARPAAKK